jgi:hypothetical protein
MNPSPLLLLLGIAIGFLGLLAERLKAERTSRVIFWIAGISFFLWIAWWTLAWLAAFVVGRNTPE